MGQGEGADWLRSRCLGPHAMGEKVQGTAAKARLSKSVRLVCRVCGRHSLYPGSLPSYFPVASLSHRDDCLLKYSLVNKQQTKVSYENSSALAKGTSRCVPRFSRVFQLLQQPARLAEEQLAATVSGMLRVPGLAHDPWRIPTSPLGTDSTGGFPPV